MDEAFDLGGIGSGEAATDIDSPMEGAAWLG